MGDREVYPNAPLVLVSVELRHPTAEPLGSRKLSAIKRHVSQRMPIPAPVKQVTLTLTPDGQRQEEGSTPRYMTRDRTSAITFGTDRIAVETTNYDRFEVLQELVDLAVEARQKYAPVDGVDRIGMRYINELRLEVDRPDDWDNWLSPALTGPTRPAAPIGMDVTYWQGVAVYGNPVGAGVVVRHGTFQGYAVDPGGELKRPSPPPGQFFLIDIDSYWTPEGGTPVLDLESARDQLNGIHRAGQQMFESLITERLRKEVLRHGH